MKAAHWAITVGAGGDVRRRGGCIAGMRPTLH